jgi:hypothetical protein
MIAIGLLKTSLISIFNFKAQQSTTAIWQQQEKSHKQ